MFKAIYKFLFEKMEPIETFSILYTTDGGTVISLAYHCTLYIGSMGSRKIKIDNAKNEISKDNDIKNHPYYVAHFVPFLNKTGEYSSNFPDEDIKNMIRNLAQFEREKANPGYKKTLEEFRNRKNKNINKSNDSNIINLFSKD